MSQFFEFERFGFDRVIPSVRKALWASGIRWQEFWPLAV
jgi:hypothetical protein